MATLKFLLVDDWIEETKSDAERLISWDDKNPCITFWKEYKVKVNGYIWDVPDIGDLRFMELDTDEITDPGLKEALERWLKKEN